MKFRPAAIVVALLLVASCSSDDEAPIPTGQASGSNATFADATCADLARFAVAMQPAYLDLRMGNDIDAEDAEAVDTYVSRVTSELDTAAAATKQLSDGIASRPAPDITDGEALKTRVVETLDALARRGLDMAARLRRFDVAEASPDERGALLEELDELDGFVLESIGELTPYISDNAELQAAFERSNTCRDLGGGAFDSSS